MIETEWYQAFETLQRPADAKCQGRGTCSLYELEIASNDIILLGCRSYSFGAGRRA